MNKITNEAEYNSIMLKIDGLMAKGSQNVSKKELAEIRALALSGQSYEHEKFDLIPSNH